MKPIKMLGVAAAVAAMALVFAPSAMAEPTGLCSTEAGEENPCESVITHVHETGKGVLLSSVGSIECEVLVLGGVTEGSPLTVNGSFAFAGCVSPTLGTCEAQEVSSEALIEALKEGHETATVTDESEVLVQCGTFLHCVYDSSGLKGTAKGPLLSTEKNGEISLQEQTVNKVSGFLCPSVAKLDLKMTPLSPTYIVGQMLCVPKVGGAWNEVDPVHHFKCKTYVGPGNGTWELKTD